MCVCSCVCAKCSNTYSQCQKYIPQLFQKYNLLYVDMNCIFFFGRIDSRDKVSNDSLSISNAGSLFFFQFQENCQQKAQLVTNRLNFFDEMSIMFYHYLSVVYHEKNAYSIKYQIR